MPREPEPLDVDVHKVRAALLSWYDRARRTLPWRAPSGARADPYAVWLSEVMLQQTTVAAVTPYFRAFLERWPTVQALAAAPREEVLAAWAGLGYYSRARNLHACAQAVAAVGGFPRDEAGLRALPGVGAYTAAAIAAIAFDRPANVVDGNVERVVARLFAVEEPLPAARPMLKALAGRLVTAERPGDWAQALMDLGATVCIPRAPRCEACPIAGACRARAAGEAALLPRKAAKAARPERHGAAYVLTHQGAVLLVRRPDTGLLGGMAALPSTPWRAEPWTAAEVEAAAPAPATWVPAGTVRHVFTHFALVLNVWRAETEAPPAGQWTADPKGLPTVFAKALARGLATAPAPRPPSGARRRKQ